MPKNKVLGKRPRKQFETKSNDNDPVPSSKKAKTIEVDKNINAELDTKADVDVDNNAILNNLDLDLNLISGRSSNVIDLNFYSPQMKEIAIDCHLHFQRNPNHAGYNILWKNKVVLSPAMYNQFDALIRDEQNDFFHFHQPSPLQMLTMYEMAPRVLQQSASCGLILHSIHKSVVDTVAETAYKQRDVGAVKKALTNLTIDEHGVHELATTTTNKNDTNDADKASLLMDDYGWQCNAFHELARTYRISPLLLVREYLKCNFNVDHHGARQICVLLCVQQAMPSESESASAAKHGTAAHAQKQNKTAMRAALSMLHAAQKSIEQSFAVQISIGVLQSMYDAIMMDCIRGYHPDVAWRGWTKKMIATRHNVLHEIYSRCKGKGSHFLEHTLIGKFRGIVDKINEQIVNEADRIVILNESEQKAKIYALQQARIALYKSMEQKTKKKSKTKNNSSGHNQPAESDAEILETIGWVDPATPDLLFNKPVMVNGTLIHWMDAKNYLVTYQDKVKYRKTIERGFKYTQTFGNGAIVSLGFVKSWKQVKYDIMLLDASDWQRNE
eukprot:CAMPEP_0202713260 /NCGR_PEP_ID=MMETSP1385-20130828/52460_1 /ASSEMBLY_ACC=CAM_ASM_000861 /TAXON_ID=933848 /ORGANISM="Elphidium margaritaceum" /LENGTH=555 /DNA_ID=CAMNT_0049373555 /DNA_START=8 /DNA_END=1675 /DNA_ORIENTATION=-